MNGRTLLGATLIAMGFLLPTKTFAQSSASYSYAYIRDIQGDLQIQRATEVEPDEATINHPVLSGDRVWTRTGSRAEIQFGDGSIVRLDERTRIDFADFVETGTETLLRLWSGSVIVRVNDPKGGAFRFDTPAGTVYPASAGLFRIDAYEGGASTVLSVYEGVVELASEGGSVLVRAGQRSLVEPGRRPEPSFAFNTAQWDTFASWSDERDRQYAYTQNIQGIPQEVEVYAGSLAPHGTWRVHVDLGPVWYPRVSAGWYPYSDGYWSYTTFGWTWVSYEPWGWAPYHYGRWGYDHGGWYWVPGVHWGPAWVSWAIGPTWVGWCPLGYYDHPVHYFPGYPYRGGKAVPRASLARNTRGDGWNFVNTKDFDRHSVGRARLRTADIEPTAARAQVLESGAVLDRNLRPRVVGAAAMTRLPKDGLAAMRSRMDSVEGGTAPGASTLMSDRVGNESRQLQAGRARSRALPDSQTRRDTLRGLAGGNTTEESPTPGSAAPSRSRSISAGASTNNAGRSNPSSSQGTRGGAIQRTEPLGRSGEESGTLTRGESRILRQPAADPRDSSRSGRTPGRIIRSRPSPTQSPTPGGSGAEATPRGSREPSSIGQPLERTPRSPLTRSPESNRGSQPSESPLRGSNRVERSNGADTPSGSSVRGRDIYDRITRSRPRTNQPSAGASPSRPPTMRAPSGPSSPPPSSSTGSARSTRKAKKKN